MNSTKFSYEKGVVRSRSEAEKERKWILVAGQNRLFGTRTHVTGMVLEAFGHQMSYYQPPCISI